MSTAATISPGSATTPYSRSATPPFSGIETETASWRDAFIDAVTFAGLTLVAITELLSQFGALTRVGAFATWGIVAVGLSGWFLRKRTRPAVITRAHIPAMSREDTYYIAFAAIICAVTLYVAFAGAPNAYDSISYHLPRVLRWIQDGTVAFYPTHIQRQLWIGPGWEYFALHLQLIAGINAEANLVQWLALVASPVVVSVIARELGAGRRGQLLAALFTLSIPMGIAQGSGSQVDLFSGFWLAVSVALLLRIKRQRMEGTGIRDAILFGAAAGIAVLSKATCALFLLPFVVWVTLDVVRDRPRRLVALAAVAIVMALAVNAGHMLRNRALYGNVLGVEGSAGVANETFGPGAFASNIVRNASLQLNTTSDAVNDVITRGIFRLHELAGLDASDQRTTFSRRFRVPPEWDDEGEASNQLHFLIIIAVAIAVTARNRKSPATRYLWCVFAGALLFCFYLKWQPWHSRLHLPLFMIAGAAIGAALEGMLSPRRLRWVAVALALTALPPTFRNSLRPIVARRPLFTIPYEERLFTDHFDAWKVFAAAADFTASHGCSKIGIIEDPDSWEFPLWKMIQRRNGFMPELRHVGVTNASRITATDRDRAFKPCAIIEVYRYARRGEKNLILLQVFPEGIPQVPAGFTEAWKEQFITVYLPTKA